MSGIPFKRSGRGPSYPPAVADSPGIGPPLSAPSDAALVAALRAGTAGALSAVFERYGQKVHHILLHLLGVEGEIPDLIHDVFLVALEDIETLHDPAALGNWLAGIAIRTARSFIRRRTRWWHWPAKRPTHVTPSHVATPDINVALRLAYTLFDQLPAKERIPLVLRLVDDMQLDEIASHCQISVSTVKRRLQRAEKRFRRLAAAHPILHEWLDK